MRMQCCPARFPERASSRLPGGTLRKSRFGAAWSCCRLLVVIRGYPWTCVGLDIPYTIVFIGLQDVCRCPFPLLNILRPYVDQNNKPVYNQLVILIFYLFLRLYSPMYPPLGYGVGLSGVHTSASRFMVSGNFSTRRISRAAWALGLARPCSQFSRVRGLVRR